MQEMKHVTKLGVIFVAEQIEEWSQKRRFFVHTAVF